MGALGPLGVADEAVELVAEAHHQAREVVHHQRRGDRGGRGGGAGATRLCGGSGNREGRDDSPLRPPGPLICQDQGPSWTSREGPECWLDQPGLASPPPTALSKSLLKIEGERGSWG